jgi:soluble P-type ATPase
MKKFNIPHFGLFEIRNIIFDINGTLQFNGKISNKLVEKFRELKQHYNLYLISSDTRGNLNELAKQLDTKYVRINTADQTDAEAKNKELLKLGKENTAAIGNGNNDMLMLKNAALGILIIGSEGASSKSLMNADVIFTNPIDAINFLLDEKAIIATLRG